MQTRLEEYLSLADGLPLDLVETTEKNREKDRRQVTREDKILQQKEEHVRPACLIPPLQPVLTCHLSCHSQP